MTSRSQPRRPRQVATTATASGTPKVPAYCGKSDSTKR
jgi:hypothetical protein